MFRSIVLGAIIAAAGVSTAGAADSPTVQLGPRPFYLVDKMADSELKTKLQACKSGPFAKSDWSIGHRGAPLQFPEHTEEGYRAAARMGAGIVECDVTFTKDRELVCRHAQDDLATTTNILTTDLASKCIQPFSPAFGGKASAKCRTADLTLSEFKSLKGKMDASDKKADTVEQFVGGTPSWRTDLYATDGTLMTLDEAIALFKSLGVKMTPELKEPKVSMPYDGDFTQEAYAQKMIDAFKAAGVDPSDVYPQSFSLSDIRYWIEHEPEFGKQAVYLDGSYSRSSFSPMNPSTWEHSMADLKAMGVNYISPPIWVLLTLEDGKIAPSEYAKEAKAAGLKIIAWSLERSGPLSEGGDWYYKTITQALHNDGDIYNVLDVLARDVGIAGMFSDWPATATFYADCMGLK